MFEKFKEEYQYIPKNDLLGFLKYQYLIKESYLSSIDVVIDSYEKYFNQSIIESPQFEHINYLKSERAKIAQYK